MLEVSSFKVEAAAFQGFEQTFDLPPFRIACEGLLGISVTHNDDVFSVSQTCSCNAEFNTENGVTLFENLVLKLSEPVAPDELSVSKQHLNLLQRQK